MLKTIITQNPGVAQAAMVTEVLDARGETITLVMALPDVDSNLLTSLFREAKGNRDILHLDFPGLNGDRFISPISAMFIHKEIPGVYIAFRPDQKVDGVFYG